MLNHLQKILACTVELKNKSFNHQNAIQLSKTLKFIFFFILSDERVGNLTVVVKNALLVPNISSQFAIIVRGNYSNPPAHGCMIVKRVLSDPSLYALW